MPEHETISGQIIEYPDPDPALATILRKLTRMAKDPDASEADMIKVAFSDQNPLLGPHIVPGRGAVTSATLLAPAWHVIQDLLTAKQVEESGLDPAKLAEEYTVPLGDAAKDIGISTSAVHQAVLGHRLPVWIKDGQYYASPQGIAMFKVGKTGPRNSSRAPVKKKAASGSPSAATKEKPREPEPLRVRVGNAPGISFRIHLVGGELEEKKKAGPGILEGIVPSWSRIGVIVGKTDEHDYRFVSCVPRAPVGKIDEYKVDGFYIRGYFTQLKEENANTSSKAHKAFENFRKEHPKR